MSSLVLLSIGYFNKVTRMEEGIREARRINEGFVRYENGLEQKQGGKEI